MNRFDGTYGMKTSKRRILVVEDSVINREMLRTLLQDDFAIVEAENGLIGLQKLEALYQDLSLILLDVYMPECDGFEFLRRKMLDSRFDSVPVIVTTAGGSLEDEIACLELGANDFVVKPYNFEIMINRINNMIRLRESAAIVNQLTWDKITGFFSKEFFYRAVEDELSSSPNDEFDMICGDIENFKALNERYGEKTCDQLLHNLAEHLATTVPAFVAGGRIGGDSLAVFARHQDQQNWNDTLSSTADDMPIGNLNLKFGIIECVDHAMGAPQICSRAISAAETVKDGLGVRIALFDDELHRRHLMEQAIRENMETALNEYQFYVCYQPKYDVHTNKIGGAEALVRWFHPEYGTISPGLFITIFEQNGFITKLDLFVWEEACKEIKRCQELGLPTVPISVNASTRDFDEPDLAEQIVSLADKYGIDHKLLHIELTETAYADNPEVVATTLETLRSMGFSTELDDFGAGYSSLVSLNMLPLDVVKLDMSMIHFATELHDYRIIDSTIKLAKVLGLKTVVEGVETAEEAEKVTSLGCDLIQGYYYSKPLKQKEFEEYLARS